MRIILTATLFLSLLCVPVLAQQVQAESYVLDNGMEFLLVPRAEQPNVIAAGWFARVGSVHERPGITGISHFFEHMMFKGTSTIGTTDPKMDAEFSAKQVEVKSRIFELQLRDQMARWRSGEIPDPWDPNYDTDEIRELRAELKALMEAQREITVKDEFDSVYTKMGGSGMNAGTGDDFTVFFINVPSNKFELWAWMESDRLSDSVFREFYSERDVVHEERRLRTESTPTGLMDEEFDAMFWQSSPYSWPVIGWPSDIYNYTLEQAKDHWDKYYRANNLVAMVVGDFKIEEIKPVIDEYFGRLVPSKSPAPPVVTLEMPQVAEKRLIGECDCQPQVEVRYHTVPFSHQDAFPLEVMAEILNGRTGRLYKSLVEEKGLAASANAGQDDRKYAGAFSFYGETKGDAAPEQLEAAWYAELERLQNEPVADHELQKVKNQILADSYRRLESNFFLLIQLAIFECRGNWEYINDRSGKLMAVTPDDIMRVAGEYFDRNNRSVAVYHRKEGSAPVDPRLAGLDPEVRGMIQQQVAAIQGLDDIAKLEGILPQVEAQKAQVPPEVAPGIDYMIEVIQNRIAELKGSSEE